MYHGLDQLGLNAVGTGGIKNSAVELVAYRWRQFACSAIFPAFANTEQNIVITADLVGATICKQHRTILAAVLVDRSEEHTSELQSRENLVCRLLLEKKKKSYSNRPCHIYAT